MTELAILTEQPRTDVPMTLAERLELAEVLSEAGMLPDHLRGKKGNIVATMYAAAALDIPLFTAFQEMHVIKGKVGVSALLMRGMVVREGHKFDVLESSISHAVVQIHRKGETKPRKPVTYSMEQAQIAEVLSNDNYQKNPAAMMVARATSSCVRQHAPECLLGFGHTPDDLENETGDGVVDVTAEQVDQDQATEGDEVVDVEVMPENELEMCAAVAKVKLADGSKKALAEALNTLRVLWEHGRQNGWLNTVCGDSGMPIGKQIIDRQNELRGRPKAASTSPTRMEKQAAEQALAAQQAEADAKAAARNESK